MSLPENPTPTYNALQNAKLRIERWFLNSQCEIVDELLVTPQRFLRHATCRAHCQYTLRKLAPTLAFSIPFPYTYVLKTSEPFNAYKGNSYRDRYRNRFYAFVSGDRQKWIPIFFPHIQDGFFTWCESGHLEERSAEEHFSQYINQVDSYTMNIYLGYWTHILPYARSDVNDFDSDTTICLHDFYRKMEQMSVLDVCEALKAIADHYPHFIEEEFIAKKEESREHQHS